MVVIAVIMVVIAATMVVIMAVIMVATVVTMAVTVIIRGSRSLIQDHRFTVRLPGVPRFGDVKGAFKGLRPWRSGLPLELFLSDHFHFATLAQ
jgi:hypothetical protein